jgi:ribosomal protein S21
MQIKSEVKLDPKKCQNKEYFEKMLKRFSNEVRKSEIMEDLRMKRCFYKPSAMRKIRKERQRTKWKFY